MKKRSTDKISMASRVTYRISIQGKLDDGWGDWFNGTIRKSEQVAGGCPCTILTCEVRDQAELLGMLNRLSSLNLPLLEIKRINLDESDLE